MASTSPVASTSTAAIATTSSAHHYLPWLLAQAAPTASVQHAFSSSSHGLLLLLDVLLTRLSQALPPYPPPSGLHLLRVCRHPTVRCVVGGRAGRGGETGGIGGGSIGLSDEAICVLSDPARHHPDRHRGAGVWLVGGGGRDPRR